jgi:GNAT superfamily N-acetyltransferase
MALPEMSVSSTVLKESLKRLNSITNQAYNDNIRQVALDTWQKHLRPENPQWRFITAKSFSIDGSSGSAHVMAMLDKRLPDIGIVGYFACTNSDIGSKVLQQACDWLKTNHKLADVYGPINGTLPSDYRLNQDDDYVFPGEPVNPKWYIDAFQKAGFSVFNQYASGRLKHFQLILKFVTRKPRKVRPEIAVRPFSNTDYDKDFKAYHDLRNLIFPFQSIYCPAISLEERIYNSSGKFDANYTYFLTDNGHEVGFIMAYPHKKQLILKTIGLLPEYRGKRLSSLLLKPVHEQASKDGLTTAIYGMVRVGNAVYKRKHPLARIFRKYVTMHKSI